MRCSISPTVSAETPARSPRARTALGATEEDLGFGEDYELLATTRFPLHFAVVGRCEEGDGVEIWREGHRVELGGWDQFRRKT